MRKLDFSDLCKSAAIGRPQIKYALNTTHTGGYSATNTDSGCFQHPHYRTFYLRIHMFHSLFQFEVHLSPL